MKAFFALVAREISERKALLAAAAVASLLPLLAPLLPSTGSNPPEDIREAVMWVVLGGLAPLFALLLGVGFIGRDLAEGRMGFYYAQPISGPMIWFARIRMTTANTSDCAERTALASASPSRKMRCARVMPIAKAIPAREITLMVRPSRYMDRKVVMTEIGIDRPITTIEVGERKKKKSTAIARKPPMKRFW